MNDFVIQGVTILGTELSSGSTVTGIVTFIMGGFILLMALFTVFYCFSEGEGGSIWFLIILATILSFSAIKVGWEEWHKEPEMIYTVSIDDSAKYNEIKNNFDWIKELPNGLYRVTLTENNSQND